MQKAAVTFESGINMDIGKKFYTYDDAFAATTEYYSGDILASSTVVKKYLLRDKAGNFLEKTPDDMHTRLALEFARIEKKMNPSCNEATYFRRVRELLNRFEKIVPQGSPLSGIGNKHQVQSLSNCFVIPPPETDSMWGVMQTAHRLAEVLKRRGGCVEENTIIVTKRGLLPIKAVKIGDEVLSFNIETGADEYRVVTDMFESVVEINEQVELIYENGTKLKTSCKHPVLTVTSAGYEYVEPRSMHGNEFGIIPSPAHFSLGKFDEKLANLGWLIGAHHGDGTLGETKVNKYEKAYRCRILGDNEAVVKVYAQRLNQLLGSTALYKKSTRQAHKTDIWEYTCNENNLMKDFADPYLDGLIGRKAYTVVPSKFIMGNNLWVPYLAGLIDTDGHVKKDGSIHLTSVSKNLISQLAEILSANGIRYNTFTKRTKRANESDNYALSIYNNERNFILQLSKYMVHDKKVYRLLNASDKCYSHTKTITDIEIEGVLKLYELQLFKRDHDCNLSAAICFLRKNQKIGIGFLNTLVNHQLLSESKRTEILQRCKLKDIRNDASVKYKYIDINVEHNHNYYAGNNGLINIHNCGFDLSTLRPHGSRVNNAALKSTGTPTFSDFFSFITRMIGQSGRNGALMLTLDVKHPDAERFATMKHDMTKVTGANVSLKISDEFMRAVEADTDFIQQFPVDAPLEKAVVVNTIRARDLWKVIVTSATNTAEPGVLFWDTICRELPADYYPGFKTSSTNPCLTGDMKLLTENGYISLEKLWEESRILYSEINSFTDLPRLKIINSSGLVDATAVYKTSDSASVFEVTFDNGTSIKATSSHTFILENGDRVQLEGLKVGDEVPLIDASGNFGPVSNQAYARSAGWVIGDGSISEEKGQQRAHVNAWDGDIQDATPTLRKDLLKIYDGFNKSTNQNPSYEFVGKPHKGFNYLRANVKSSVLGGMMKEDGLTPGDKHKIPESIWMSDKKTIAAFLNGLFSADGSVQINNSRECISVRLWQASNEKPELILGCQLLLSQYGIKCSVSLRRKASKQLMNDGKGGEKLYNRKPGWELIISGRHNCQIFGEEIGFIQQYKNDKLREWLASHLGSNNSIVKWGTKVKSIEYIGEEPTYCLTEFESNEICINGIRIGQCAELPLSPYDSCRLISNNLSGWVKNPYTEKAHFDFEEYYEDTKIAQRMSDGLVELELEVVEKIVDVATDEPEKEMWRKIHYYAQTGRRTGLGTHGLGDTLLALGVKYDSNAAIEVCHKIYSTHRDSSYTSSVEMAKERGPFPIWDWKTDIKCPFIQRLPDGLKTQIKKHGRRNISNLTVAPTGSIAIASQTSSGIEPAFRWVYDRRVKITHTDIGSPVDFVDAVGDKWTMFRVLHPAIKNYFKAIGQECPIKEGRNFEIGTESAHKALQKILPEHFVTSDTIDYMKGVELQSVIQSMIDHGLSKTCNMPKGTTIQQVADVYFSAWKQSLKGFTIYVDGSRDGVLVTTDTEKEKSDKADKRPEKIIDTYAPKRSRSLPAEIHHTKVRGNEWQVIVGMMDGRPYELFAGQGLLLPKARTVEEAWIVKKGPKKYCLDVRIKDNGVEEVGDLCEVYDNEEQRVITRTVCTSLRHGVPVEFVMRDLLSHEGNITDYASALARVLKKYVSRPSLMVKSCMQCGGTEFAMVESCPQCVQCGWAKCN